ncbi:MULTISPECIES: flagellar protein FlaG [unclassified Cupriavidus]|uniref:flagellar protein FlaG n=1 Tax=Cupriavidus sp. H19C3 TaxID=3241603 RepID=UPI0011D318EB|nr:MAG: flagellar protein FlaG [Cupriavidus sp.]
MAHPTTASTPATHAAAQSTATGQAPAAVAAAKAFGKAQRTVDAVTQSSATPEASSTDTSEAMRELVDVLKTTSIGLRFEIDDKTHRVITKVIDKDTGEVIRQMPNEEVLRVARAIDKLQGLFVSHAV